MTFMTVSNCSRMSVSGDAQTQGSDCDAEAARHTERPRACARILDYSNTFNSLLKKFEIIGVSLWNIIAEFSTTRQVSM